MIIKYFTWTKYNGDEPENIVENLNNDKVKEWVERFIEFIKDKSVRHYEFNSETGEVCSTVTDLLNSKTDGVEFILARRLKNAEEKTRRRSPVLDIRDGSLIQIMFSDESDFDSITYILAKIDYSFVLREALDVTGGLPLLKQDFKFKLCKITASSDESGIVINEMVLGDNNPQISVFWSDDFLESYPINDNAVNSKRAYDGIKNFFVKEIKKKSPGDYTELRNQLVAYMRCNNSFDIEKMAESVVGCYQPDNADIDIDSIKTKLLALPDQLPDRKKFDKRFDIEHKAIKGRFRMRFLLTDDIVLETKHDVSDLANTIKPMIYNNEKGVWIKSETGFNAFPGSKKNNDEHS